MAAIYRFLLAAMLLALAAGPATAEARFATDHVEVELVSELGGLPAEGGTVWFALRQQIIPHWHTYWQNPGDSGEPTDIDWSLPAGFEAGAIVWPTPERQPYGPLVNFGYSHEAILLVPVTVPAGLEPGATIEISAQVYWLVCADVCIPEEGPVSFSLPVVAGTPPLNLGAADIFARGREALPQPSPWEARFEEQGGTLRVAVLGDAFESAFDEGRIREVTFFPGPRGMIDNASEQAVRYGADGLTISVPSGARFRRGAEVESLSGLVVISEQIDREVVTRAVSVEATRDEIPFGAADRAMGGGWGGQSTLWQAALFALLGGIILNLMPCVFPIVFLKALTFVAVAHERPWRVRFHGLFYTLGILTTFSLIAILLLALRAGGAQIGWGFQLQSPLVVGGFIVALFLVGLNLSGVFNVGGSVMGLGGSLAERRGYSGSFFTGVLAVVVAAPCTAPFMGVALGYALTQSAFVGFVIFLVLGLGLALPYLLLSFVPALLRLLPRPGAWMEWLKQALAVPIYAWVLYLLWVLAQQVSMTVVGLLLASLLVIGIFLAAYQTVRTRSDHSLFRYGGIAAVVAVMAVVLLFLPRGLVSTNAEAHVDDVIVSIPYSEASLSELRGEGETVFLNFTAAWCITCLLNERVVFSSTDFAERFEATGAVYMKADWTNRDAEISRALDRFGRPGVPLYVVYRPGREPQVLPQVLTADILLTAIEGR